MARKKTAADKKFDEKVKSDLGKLTDTQQKRYKKLNESASALALATDTLSERKKRHADNLNEARKVK